MRGESACGRFEPPAQQPPDLVHHTRDMRVLTRAEQFQVSAQAQVKAQLGQRHVGLAQHGPWLLY
jgi:hypothetical protein